MKVFILVKLQASYLQRYLKRTQSQVFSNILVVLTYTNIYFAELVSLTTSESISNRSINN